ncbi:MAG: CHASE3 domain-containing protein [Cyanobacteria bacterium P01_E01_bin.42]
MRSITQQPLLNSFQPENSPSSRWKLGRVLIRGLGGIVFLNIVFSLIVYGTNRSMAETLSWVSHTNQVKADLRLLEKILVDAETGQRGFIFTGRENFLEPYNNALGLGKRKIQQLKALVSDNPAQVQRLTDIEPLVDDKFAELARTIDLKRNGREQELRTIILSEQGKQRMDEIRERLEEMEQIEAGLLARRQNQAMQMEKLSRVAIASGTSSIIGIIFIVLWSIRHRVVQPIETLSLDIVASSVEISSAVSEHERITNQQAVSAHETTVAIDELAKSSQQIAHQAEATVASGHEVLSLTQKSQEAVDLSLQEVTTLKGNIETIVRHARDLERRTTEIGKISNLVGEIAIQTNLLALNAAIEAVRAEERGRGFSVVAAEIRKLADQSQESARQISNLVEEITRTIQSTVRTIFDGTQIADNTMQVARVTASTFDTVNASIEDMAIDSQQISSNIKQQDLAIQQIAGAMNDITRGMNQTATSINQTKVSMEQLKTISQALSQLM